MKPEDQPVPYWDLVERLMEFVQCSSSFNNSDLVTDSYGNHSAFNALDKLGMLSEQEWDEQTHLRTYQLNWEMLKVIQAMSNKQGGL